MPGFQDRERAFFDALVARTGDTWWGNTGPAGMCRLERRAAIVASRLAPRARVLELGCGAGSFTLALVRRLPEIELHAVDISPVALEAAKRRAADHPRVQFHTADILNLPPIGSFDAVVGNGILHHVPVERALLSVTQCLRPGGKALFFEPNLLNPHVALEKLFRPIGALMGNTPDEQAFSRYQIVRVLAESGFRAVAAEPIEFVHPKTPQVFLSAAVRVSRFFERVPVVKEFAGSMQIFAQKPADAHEPVRALAYASKTVM